MAKGAKLKTPEEVQEEFTRSGASIADWARKMGFNPKRVYDVLQRRSPGARGEAHRIAVKLGLKDGIAETVN